MVRFHERLRFVVAEWPTWPSGEQWREIRPLTRVIVLGLVGWCAFAVIATLAAIAFVGASGFKSVGLLPKKSIMPEAVFATDEAAISLQRPLFLRSRQAASPQLVVTQSPPIIAQQSDVQRDASIGLKGVFINGQLMRAFLISAQNPTGAWVAPDETVGGWRLATIRPQEIELEGGGQRIVVSLSAARAPDAGGQRMNAPSPTRILQRR